MMMLEPSRSNWPPCPPSPARVSNVPAILSVASGARITLAASSGNRGRAVPFLSAIPVRYPDPLVVLMVEYLVKTSLDSIVNERRTDCEMPVPV
ncbi:hypothetical protein D9M73_146890 [compost metagenome]